MSDTSFQHPSRDALGRVAIVDLLFSWPPNGGADVDLYHVAAGLAAQGITLRVFVLQLEGSPARGQVARPDETPFPLEIVFVPATAQTATTLIGELQRAVDAWHPDVVFLSHGYALKPHLALALAHYPLVSRYYAHELFCARDPLRFRDGASCPYQYLTDPDTCRPCALARLGAEIKAGHPAAWAQDYLLAAAYTHRHYQATLQSLEVMSRIVVSNEEFLGELGKHRKKTVVIPGGIDVAAITPDDLSMNDASSSKKVIFMAGRVEDPQKGLHVLQEATASLARTRSNFHVVVTHFDHRLSTAQMTATGWLSHEETLQHYRAAHICVVPSLWREPFGLVAVEAMAAGVPVCASDTGGLRDIVVHGETGFLFSPGDAKALAHYLALLLDDEALRRTLGAAGKERVRERYTWDAIVQRHYLPLIADLTSGRSGSGDQENTVQGNTP